MKMVFRACNIIETYAGCYFLLLLEYILLFGKWVSFHYSFEVYVAANQKYATTFYQIFVAEIHRAATLILPNLSHKPNNLSLPQIMASHTCGWCLTLIMANCGWEPDIPDVTRESTAAFMAVFPQLP